jgi:hypothetical protein
MLQFSYGIEDNDQTQNSPRRFLHLIIAGGDLDGFASPTVDVPPTRPPARYLGVLRLGGSRGKLYLQRPYSRGGGLHGNHLIFVWTEKGIHYGLSIHSWKRPETVAFAGRLISALGRVCGARLCRD